MLVATAACITGVPSVGSETLTVGPSYLRIRELYVRLIEITSQTNELVCKLGTFLHLLLGQLLEEVYLLFFIFLILRRR